jgi:hypothetical protein
LGGISGGEWCLLDSVMNLGMNAHCIHHHLLEVLNSNLTFIRSQLVEFLDFFDSFLGQVFLRFPFCGGKAIVVRYISVIVSTVFHV